MKTAVKPVSHFQMHSDPISSVMNFDLGWLDEQSAVRAASGHSGIDGSRARRFKPAVIPIDIPVGQIDILWKLDRSTLERMATNPCTPVVALERLANHPMADVRAAVSDNVNAPLYILWTLSEDADANVRYQLAENYSLPLAVLRSLTNDYNPYVACRAQQTLGSLKAV